LARSRPRAPRCCLISRWSCWSARSFPPAAGSSAAGTSLTDAQAPDPALEPAYFRRDRLALWLLAIGLPFALTALFKGLALAFA
jgi:hypothetical protein